MSTRPAAASGRTPTDARNANRLADVLSAGLAAMNLKTQNVEAPKRGRESREEADHGTVMNMGLTLSPFAESGPVGEDFYNGTLRPIERGRYYYVRRFDGSKGFFACRSRAAPAPDYAVGFISRASKYAAHDNYFQFMQAVVYNRMNTAQLRASNITVQYSRALPEVRGQETSYTNFTDKEATDMASNAEALRNGTNEFSNWEEQAFGNVYLFYKVRSAGSDGKGVYLSLGRFVVQGYQRDNLTLIPIAPRLPSSSFGNMRPVQPRFSGPLTPDQSAIASEGMALLAEAADKATPASSLPDEEDEEEDEEDEEEEEEAPAAPAPMAPAAGPSSMAAPKKYRISRLPKT